LLLEGLVEPSWLNADEAERSGARLKIGNLVGLVETRIRGRSGSLAVWL
jgi:hypothetical protein